MGIFDTYIDKHTGVSIQIKDSASQNTFYIGDNVLMDDGVYFALEGVVVIRNARFVGAFPYSSGKDKWGNDISPKLNYFRDMCLFGSKDVLTNIHRCLERNKNEYV